MFKHFKFGSSKGNKQNPFRIFFAYCFVIVADHGFCFGGLIRGKQ